jgi:hypothetical protein
MKKGIIILLAVFVLGCNKKSDVNEEYNLSANSIVTLKYKECVDISDFGFKICLDSILNDSRCPSGVVCVWEGDAEVGFIIEKANEIKHFRLHTQGNFQRDTTINGLKISLQSLIPYPADGSEIDQKDYSAEIIVSDE